MRLVPTLAFAIALASSPARAATSLTCAQADAQVRDILVGILDVDESRVVPSATLKDLGEDLTDAADISIAIEKLFDLELQDEDYDNVVSVLSRAPLKAEIVVNNTREQASRRRVRRSRCMFRQSTRRVNATPSFIPSGGSF